MRVVVVVGGVGGAVCQSKPYVSTKLRLQKFFSGRDPHPQPHGSLLLIFGSINYFYGGIQRS